MIKEATCYNSECTLSVINSSTFSIITITKTTINDLLSSIIIISNIMVIIQSEGQLKGDTRNWYPFINRKYLMRSLMSADISVRSRGGGSSTTPTDCFELISGIISAWWWWLEERGPPCQLSFRTTRQLSRTTASLICKVALSDTRCSRRTLDSTCRNTSYGFKKPRHDPSSVCQDQTSDAAAKAFQSVKFWPEITKMFFLLFVSSAPPE